MSSQNWKLADVDDFVIFMASDDIIEGTNRRKNAANAANERFFAEHPAKTVPMPVTGSFIYAQPPNYRGLPMLHAGEEEWLKLFGRLKSMHVDTVILQAAVWNELGSCYYPSKHFRNFRVFDCVGPMLRAAKQASLQVYLGGYGSVCGWSATDNKKVETQREKDNHFACLDELSDLYGGLFQGIYFAPETAYRGERNPRAEEMLNEIYRSFCGRIRSMHPGMKILMSPATKYFEGKGDEMTASWNAILADGAAPDILAPQDSIGCCGNLLEHQKETFRWWRSICDANRVELWSNVEVFEGADCSQINTAIPADPRRVACQILHASEVASKLISWELPYYTDDVCGERGKALRDFLASLPLK